MSIHLSDYEYPLPETLIAKRPLPQRDAARMMVLHRHSQKIEHCRFGDLPNFLGPGDLLVLNNTRVVPARVFSDDRAIEFLFLEKLGVARWKCLVRPGRKMRVGAATHVGGARVQVDEVLSFGERVVSLSADIDVYATGAMPIPPYIHRPSDNEDAIRYQTVFAREDGAVAAPTAGLHFTEAMLADLPHTFITLHVGPGTFRPVHSENVTEHKMHAEKFSIPREVADKINRANKIVAVGTTTVRTLEAAARKRAASEPASLPTCLQAQTGETNIFIYPGFEFRIVDALVTNFHLPKSTLLMLVSALAGREFILSAYAEAVREKYRFYSYGDCMLIL